ncbi:hypothetical protein D3C77_807060 [compost metagenome]
MQRHRHHDGLNQHHQLEHFADAKKHHEQRNPRQSRDLRQAYECREQQTLQTPTETQHRAKYSTDTDPSE